MRRPWEFKTVVSAVVGLGLLLGAGTAQSVEVIFGDE